MIRVMLVGAGGFVGAVARYAMTGLIHRRVDVAFPAGTLAVNTLGCFLISVLMSLVEDRQLLAPDTRAFLTIGVLGGFTTFSTFGYETLEMVRRGSYGMAAWNVAGSLLLGLAAVIAGVGAARLALRS